MSFDIFQNIMTASDPAGGRAIKVTLQTGIDDAESYYTKSDSAGGRAIKVSLIDSGALILAGNVPLSTTPTNVADGAGNTSPLQLSTNQVRIGRESNDTPLALFGTKGSLAIFNTFSVGGGNKTFSFPNANMTFAGIDIAQTFTENQIFSVAGAASTPAISLTGIWFKSGTTTTTKPQFLIEPTSTSSTNWSILGTGLGINAASDFSGNLLDLQKNGVSVFNVSSSGAVTSTSSMTLGSSSLSAIRLYVRSDGTNSVFRVDNSTPQRLFEVDNNNRLILGNSGLLLAYGNSNFALTSQLPTGYSYIFGNGTTKASASAVMGTFQLNESISNPSGANSSYRGVELNYSINNSAGAVTGTATGILVNGTETGSGLNGMTHNLMDLQRGGVSQFRVDRVGAFSCGNTVASAFAVSSTHKVTVVIGGVTYYLLASNV